MAKNRLRYFVFDHSCDTVPGFVNGEGTPEGRKIARDVCDELRRTHAMTAYFYYALLKAKVVLDNPPGPPIERTWVHLTATPRPEPYSDWPRHLYVDLHFDPMDVLDLPRDKNVLGPLYLKWVDEALAKLAQIDGFPCDVIRAACEEFRANRFMYPFKAGHAMIPGTKIKGTIMCYASPEKTTRYLFASFRGRYLFHVKLSERDRPDMQFYAHFKGFEREGSVVTVVPGFFDVVSKTHVVPEARLDLADFPEVFSMMRAKGWCDYVAPPREPRWYEE